VIMEFQNIYWYFVSVQTGI